MRLQIRRWPKEHVPSLFASHEQQLSKQTVAEILSNEPVDLAQEDVITVIGFFTWRRPRCLVKCSCKDSCLPLMTATFSLNMKKLV
jgi:hypothetical protein